jgi:hypothetical protein
MTCVIAEGDWFAVGTAESPLGAQNEELTAKDVLWLPTHSDALGQAKQVAAGGGTQKFVGEGKCARRAWSFGLELEQRVSGGKKVGGDWHEKGLSHGRDRLKSRRFDAPEDAAGVISLRQYFDRRMPRKGNS